VVLPDDLCAAEMSVVLPDDLCAAEMKTRDMRSFMGLQPHGKPASACGAYGLSWAGMPLKAGLPLRGMQAPRLEESLKWLAGSCLTIPRQALA